jgi:hypothetical protein
LSVPPPILLATEAKSSLLLLTQEGKVVTDHFNYVGAGFLLRDQAAADGVRDREFEI